MPQSADDLGFGRPDPPVMPVGLNPAAAAIWLLQRMRGGNSCIYRTTVQDNGQVYRLTVIAEHADY